MEKGKENPYSCVVLAGVRSMDERRRNLDAFRSGDVRFLICTDVAARGLDIKVSACVRSAWRLAYPPLARVCNPTRASTRPPTPLLTPAQELPYVINMTLPDEPENYIHRIGRVGRADRMGLAISLIASPPPKGSAGSGWRGEKVWYHSKCADRGRNCSNTKLLSEGGCTIWYDEPGLMEAVRKRLQMAEALPAMGCVPGGIGPAGTPLPYAFALPPALAALGAIYGEEKGDGERGPSEHVQAIHSAVAQLAALEVRAQNAFLALKIRWAQASSSC